MSAATLDLDAIRRAGARRAAALETAKTETDAIALEIRRAAIAGAVLNVSEIAQATGLSRVTIYRYLVGTGYGR